MRIIGGRFGGRILKAPAARTIRPTADRLRENLFNILAHREDNPIQGAAVIDLFAGTGALGLEALSRGAAYALFVDNGVEARALLRANIEALGVAGIDTRLSPRRDAAWRGAGTRPLQTCFSRSALWPGPCFPRTSRAARRQLAWRRRTGDHRGRRRCAGGVARWLRLRAVSRLRRHANRPRVVYRAQIVIKHTTKRAVPVKESGRKFCARVLTPRG